MKIFCVNASPVTLRMWHVTWSILAISYFIFFARSRNILSFSVSAVFFRCVEFYEFLCLCDEIKISLHVMAETSYGFRLVFFAQKRCVVTLFVVLKRIYAKWIKGFIVSWKCVAFILWIRTFIRRVHKFSNIRTHWIKVKNFVSTIAKLRCDLTKTRFMDR